MKLRRPYWIAYIRTAESPRFPAPNLQSLVLSNLDIRPGPDQGLLIALYNRRDKNALKSLAVRSCRVYDSKYEEWLRELVERVTWDAVMVIEFPSEVESRDESEDEDFIW